MLGASLCFAQGTYVRKKVAPNVYIPKTALDKPEKLPEFYYPVQDNLKEAIDDLQDAEVRHVEVKTEVIKTQKIIKKPAVQAPQREQIAPEPAQEFAPNTKYADLLLPSETEEAPLYLQKYDEYIADITSFVETGSMPENIGLEKDLAMMNTSERKEFK